MSIERVDIDQDQVLRILGRRQEFRIRDVVASLVDATFGYNSSRILTRLDDFWYL